MTTTNAAGRYTVTAVNGAWEVRAYPPAGVLTVGTSDAFPVTVAGTTVSRDLALNPLLKPARGDSIDGDTKAKLVDGIPVVRWDEPLTIRTYNCSRGTAVAEILTGTSVRRRIVLIPNPRNRDALGNIEFSATTPPLAPIHGKVGIRITKRCGGDDDPRRLAESASSTPTSTPAGTCGRCRARRSSAPP